MPRAGVPTCRGRFDALKCNRALGCDANVAWSGFELDRPEPGRADLPTRDSKGLMPFTEYVQVREDMRIPPLRSAV